MAHQASKTEVPSFHNIVRSVGVFDCPCPRIPQMRWEVGPTRRATSTHVGLIKMVGDTAITTTIKKQH